MGKSALVANIAENVAVEKKQPVAFFSLEMSETELAHRFLACRARIAGDKLRKGQVKNALAEGPQGVEPASRTRRSGSTPPPTSRSSTCAPRRGASTRRTGGLGLVIVDYMQLMRADDPRQSRVEQVGAISRGLKLLAGELERPGAGALPALARARAAARQEADPLRPSRVREPRAGRGRRLLHLPPGVLRATDPERGRRAARPS